MKTTNKKPQRRGKQLVGAYITSELKNYLWMEAQKRQKTVSQLLIEIIQTSKNEQDEGSKQRHFEKEKIRMTRETLF